MKDSAFHDFSEEAQEALDFARCQRPDGSYYGTGGVCRKGASVGAKEKDVTKEKRDSSKDLKNKRGTVVGTSPRNMLIDNRTMFQKRLKDARSDEERQLLQKVINDINKRLEKE